MHFDPPNTALCARTAWLFMRLHASSRTSVYVCVPHGEKRFLSRTLRHVLGLPGHCPSFFFFFFSFCVSDHSRSFSTPTLTARPTRAHLRSTQRNQHLSENGRVDRRMDRCSRLIEGANQDHLKWLPWLPLVFSNGHRITFDIQQAKEGDFFWGAERKKKKRKGRSGLLQAGCANDGKSRIMLMGTPDYVSIRYFKTN